MDYFNQELNASQGSDSNQRVTAEAAMKMQAQQQAFQQYQQQLQQQQTRFEHGQAIQFHPRQSQQNNNTNTNAIVPATMSVLDTILQQPDTPLGLTSKELTLLQPEIRAAVEGLVSRDKGIVKNEAFLASMQDQVLANRVSAHLRTEEDLRRVEIDVGEALDKGLKSRQTLDSLETHVLNLRRLLRTTDTDAGGSGSLGLASSSGSNNFNNNNNNIWNAGSPPPPTYATSKIKSAADTIADELDRTVEVEDTEPCPKCGKRFLGGFLKRHLEECDGVKRHDDDEDYDEENGSGIGDSVVGRQSDDDDDDDDDTTDSAGDDDDDDGTGGINKKNKKKKSKKGEGKHGKGIKTMEQLKAELALKRDGMSSCPVCMRSYPKARIEKHTNACQKKRVLAAKKGSQHAGTVSLEKATPPNAPVRLKSLAPTSCAIPLLWEPPIFDGGAPVFDYHVQVFKRTEVKLSRKEVKIEEHEMPTVSTSRWLFAAPVAHAGYVLTNLDAETEYVHIRVRAVNEKGPGEWSEEIHSIRTLAAVPPSPPLQLVLDPNHPPTASTITFQFEAPLVTGGSSINQYELRYYQHFGTGAEGGGGATTTTKGTDNAKKKLIPHSVRIAAPASQYALTGLKGNTLYTDFVLIAISLDNQMSVPSVSIKQVTTKPMEREEEILFELAEKRAIMALDVEVFYGKVHQIMNREAYISLLEGELAAIRARRGDVGAGGGGSSSSASSPAVVAPPPPPPERLGPVDVRAAEINTRKEQFEYRLHAIQAQIDGCSDMLMRLLERRAQLKHVLVTSDRRWRVLGAEYDHLKDYTGKFIDSAVMHGRHQRFRAEYLRQMIRDELDEVEDTLGAGKKEMVAAIERSEEVKRERETLEAQLKERKAALLAFEKEEARRQRALVLAARIDKGGVFRCFRVWKDQVRARKASHQLFYSSLLKWSNLGLTRAFRKWQVFVLEQRRAEKMSALEEKDTLQPGLGSAMLAAAWKQRLAAMDDATSLMTWLRGIEEELDSSDASLAYRRGLRAVDTTHISASKGVVIGNSSAGRSVLNASSSSSSGAGAGAGNGTSTALVPLGPAFPVTLSLSQVSISRAAPNLKLVDGAAASFDPGTQDIIGALFNDDINNQELAVTDYRFIQASKHALKMKGAEAINTKGLAEQVDSYIYALLNRAESYMKSGMFDQALLAAKQVEMVYGFRKDPRGLLAVYRILSMILEKVGRFDLSVLHWSRAEQLARMPEVNDPMAVAEALEGKGRGLYQRASFQDALLAQEKAEDLYEERNDFPAMARLYREQAATYRMLHFHEKADRLIAKASEIESRRDTLIRKGLFRLRELEMELVGMGVGDDTRTVTLQVCGPSVPLIRQQLRFVGIEVFRLRNVLKTTKQVADREQRRLELLQAEVKRADTSGERTMETNVLPGGAHVYEIYELRQALRSETERVTNVVQEANRECRTISTRMANLEDEIRGLDDYMGAETRELAKVAYASRPLRAIGLNVSNWRTNHVLGIATGGVAKFAAVLDAQVHVYSTLDGELLNTFVGDTEANAMSKPVGHTKHITCVAYCGTRVYTGSSDCTVRGWDAEQERGWGKHTPVEAAMEAEEKTFLAKQMEESDDDDAGGGGGAAEGEDGAKGKVRRALTRDPDVVRRRKAGEICVMRGHEGTVVSLAANYRVVVSGGADKMVIVWHPLDGRMLRRLRGHEFSVTSLAIDDTCFVSGSADREIRMWEIKDWGKKNPAKVVEQVRKYKGHSASITALAVAGHEVVSGSANGEVIVWDFFASRPLRRHQVHDIGRTVYCLQFDAVKIVTAGADYKLVFTDLISGEPIQTTLRPHGDSHILALGFDTERLITVSADRCMRHWAMKGSDPVPVAKLHILRPGEKLVTVARKYDIKVKDLMRWNGIEDVRKYYEGMRILVAPPAGTEAYEAIRKAETDAVRAREKAIAAAAAAGGGRHVDASLQAAIVATARAAKEAEEKALALGGKVGAVVTRVDTDDSDVKSSSNNTGSNAAAAVSWSDGGGGGGGAEVSSSTTMKTGGTSMFWGAKPATTLSAINTTTTSTINSHNNLPASAINTTTTSKVASSIAAAGVTTLQQQQQQVVAAKPRFWLAPGDDQAAATPFGFIPAPRDRKQYTSDQLLKMHTSSAHSSVRSGLGGVGGGGGVIFDAESVTVASISRLPSSTNAYTKFQGQNSALGMYRSKEQQEQKQAAAAAAATVDGSNADEEASLHLNRPVTPVATATARAALVVSPLTRGGGTTVGTAPFIKQRTLRSMAMEAQGIKEIDATTADSLLSAHVAQLSTTLPPELQIGLGT